MQGRRQELIKCPKVGRCLVGGHLGWAWAVLKCLDEEPTRGRQIPFLCGEDVDDLAGHCCVCRWTARAGCVDAFLPRPVASANVELRWIPVPAGGDHGGCALVLALWALLPGRRGVAGRAWHRGRSCHCLSVGAAVHPAAS